MLAVKAINRNENRTFFTEKEFMIRKFFGLALLLSATATSAFAGTVPEIDPGSAVGAMALLTTGVAMIMDRRRAK